MPDVISISELTANFDSACDETDGEAIEAEGENTGTCGSRDTNVFVYRSHSRD
jgi:hypothetical protein